MQLKSIIYNIKNLKGGGITSDDAKLSDDQYADIIHYYRSKLIRQEIDRGMRLDPLLIQPLLDIELERVEFDRGEPLSGKTVFRTVDKIPRAIATKSNNLVTFVGNNLLGKSFQRTTPYKAQYDTARAFTGLEPKWFEFDNRIYVITEDSLTDIAVQLVAENPTDVLIFTKSLNVFNPLAYEYPLSSTMLDSIYKLMADMELKYGSLPTDDLNDGLDSPTNSK